MSGVSVKLPTGLFILYILLATAVLPAASLTAGDHGYGLTVFTGNNIERFDVEVLGQVQNNQMNEEELRSSGRSWLIRVSGEQIEARGGISQGMSGSPVYINDRLVGAVSSSWTVTDHLVGLMTPIEEMRELYTRENNRKIKVGAPRATPVFISGLGERNLHGLQRLFKAEGYRVVRGGAATENEGQDIPLVPGQAIAVVLARGDVNIFTIGTMTEVRPDGRFLALGHAFMKRGAVNWFLAPAQIHHTFDSAEASFKMGVPMKPRGSILQDRNAGVMGKSGIMPRVTHVTVHVTDERENRQGTLKTTVVRDHLLLTEVAAAAVMQGVDRVADRELDETVHLTMTASLHDGHGSNWHCTRTTRGGFEDPRGFIDQELSQFITGITENPQTEIVVDDLTLQLMIDPIRKRQAITHAELDTPPVKGEDAIVRIQLEGFRAPDSELAVTLPIPVNLDDGEYQIVVEAGETGGMASAISPVAPLSVSNGRDKEASFGTYLERLSENGRGDRIRVSLQSAEKIPPEKPEHPALEKFQTHRRLLAELARETDERKVYPDRITSTFLPVDQPTVGTQTIHIAFGDNSTAPTAPDEGDLP